MTTNIQPTNIAEIRAAFLRSRAVELWEVRPDLTDDADFYALNNEAFDDAINDVVKTVLLHTFARTLAEEANDPDWDDLDDVQQRVWLTQAETMIVMESR